MFACVEITSEVGEGVELASTVDNNTEMINLNRRGPLVDFHTDARDRGARRTNYRARAGDSRKRARLNFFQLGLGADESADPRR